MPFSEKELRAMLEDNSSEIPPMSDLAVTAQARGRRIRRQRNVAAGIAGAAVIALGAVTLPGLFGDDGAAPVLAAKTASPSPSPTAVDVDVSVFGMATGDVNLLKGLTGRTSWLDEGLPLGVRSGGSQPIVTGTVTGFQVSSSGVARKVPSGAEFQLISLRMQIDRKISGGAESEPGKTLEVPVALAEKKDGTARFEKAVPAGARVAVIENSGAAIAWARSADPRAVDMAIERSTRRYTVLGGPGSILVFEDSDAQGTRLVSSTGELPNEWTGATTVAALGDVLAAEKAEVDRLCPPAPTPATSARDKRHLVEENRRSKCIVSLRDRMLRERKASASPTPVSPSPTS